MAKWGEGDPRWIVEQRKDAHNVNNWHWKEVDADKWSKAKITDLLMAVKVEDGPYDFVINEVKEVKGESMASNRKNRIITWWDYTIEIKFEVNNKKRKSSAKGTIKIPNFSQENDIEDDLDLTSTRFDKDEVYDDDALKFAKVKGHPEIRKALKIYTEILVTEFAASVCQVPSNASDAKSEAPKANTPKAKLAEVEKKPEKKIVESNGHQIKTKKLILRETFMCAKEDFYNVLVERPRVDAWSRGAQQYDCRVGGEFVLFNGNCTGTFTDLKINEKIVQRWRLKHWPAAHFSVATISLEQGDKGTKMTLEQTGVPENEVEKTKAGWKNYYWNPIKFTFGFGVEIS